MSQGVNRAIIIGNLGADPETRYTASGTAVTNISVATSEQWTDKQSGDKQERTEWHRIVLWQRLAEVASEYLRKGSKVYIEGQIKTRKWTGRDDNIDRYTTEIHAREMQMLDSKPTGTRPPPQGEYSTPPQGGRAADYRAVSQGAPQRPASSAPQQQAWPQAPQGMPAGGDKDAYDDPDDAIPF